jgi:hypothetical protein
VVYVTTSLALLVGTCRYWANKIVHPHLLHLLAAKKITTGRVAAVGVSPRLMRVETKEWTRLLLPPEAAAGRDR